jgi:serine/threonine-protein kinase
MNASNTMGGADTYLSALVSDSTSAKPNGDSSSVSVDTAAAAPPPTVAGTAPTQPALATAEPDSTPMKTTPIYPPTVAVPPTATQLEKTAEPEPVKEPEQVRKGWLSITATPSVDVYIDGMYRGDASPSLPVELTSGRHRLECEKPGHVTYEETVHITAGEFSTRRIMLTKLQGHLSISTMAGAEVYVDGKLIGVTPLRRALELDAGTHQVTVKKAGFNVWSNQITVNGDETLPLSIILSPLY